MENVLSEVMLSQIRHWDTVRSPSEWWLSQSKLSSQRP